LRRNEPKTFRPNCRCQVIAANHTLKRGKAKTSPRFRSVIIEG
jgi:hypothetical protein